MVSGSRFETGTFRSSNVDLCTKFSQHFPNIYIRTALSDCLSQSKQSQYSMAMIKELPKASLNVAVVIDISLS